MGQLAPPATIHTKEQKKNNRGCGVWGRVYVYRVGTGVGVRKHSWDSLSLSPSNSEKSKKFVPNEK